MAKYDFLNEQDSTPLFEYYKKHGENRASAAVETKLRMKNGLARKMAIASIKVGAHIKGGYAAARTGVQKRNGYASIKKLLQWQKENGHLEKLHSMERTEEWRQKISDANRGKEISEEMKKHLSNVLREKVANMTEEERKEKYTPKNPVFVEHTEEHKQMMREAAKKRVQELGDEYISQERRMKMREENGIRVAVYYYNEEKKGDLYGVYLSQRHAQDSLKQDTGMSFQISHCLKGRAKRFGATKTFGGVFAEYISREDYEKLV
jgi:hypothetical protein